MLSETVDVEADLVRELDLVEEPSHALVRADRVTRLGIRGGLAEAVDPELHATQTASAPRRFRLS
jgi:hypothetical protein